MLRRFSSHSLLLCIVLVSIVCDSNIASAQDKFPLESLKLKGANNVQLINNWHITGKKTSVAIIKDFTKTLNPVYGTIQISSNGNVTPFKSFKSFVGPVAVNSHWITSFATPAAKSGDSGYIIVMRPTNTKRTKGKFEIASFTKTGKVSKLKKLAKFRVKNSEKIHSFSLTSATCPESVGIVARIQFTTKTSDRVFKTKILFFEIDFKGKLLGKIRELVVPNDEKWNRVITFKPAWTENGWFLHAEYDPVKLQKTGNFEFGLTVNRQLLVYVISKESRLTGEDIEPNLLRKEETMASGGFGNAFLVLNENGTSPRPSAQSYTLLYTHIKSVPVDEQRFDEPKLLFEHTLQEMTDAGEPLGNPEIIQFERWAVLDEFPSNFEPTLWDDVLSNILPDGSGGFYFLRYRTVTFAEFDQNIGTVGHEFRQRYEFFHGDLSGNAPVLMSASETDHTDGIATGLHLRRFRNGIQSLISITDQSRMLSDFGGNMIYFSNLK